MRWLLATVLCAACFTAHAQFSHAPGEPPTQVELAGIFGDHMVLQRGAPLRIWGRAPVGERVQVLFRGEGKTALADRQGHWQVFLRAAPAGGPHQLTVRGRNTLRLSDVLVGDVWVCAGQSNMEWTVGQSLDAGREVASANYPQIRHVKIAHRVSLQPMDDIEPTAWKVSSPTTTAEFSAAGYFFARKLQQELHVPIGLVNASWGGTHAETWISRAALARDPDFAPLIAAFPDTMPAWLQQQAGRSQVQIARWQPGLEDPLDDSAHWSAPGLDDSRWPSLVVPRYWEKQGLEDFDGHVWYRRTVELDTVQAAQNASLHLGAIDDCDETWVNGHRLGGLCAWDQPRSYALPPGLLRAGSNVIAVRVTDTGGGGGFHGNAARVRLELGNTSLPLEGLWKARIESALVKEQPQPNDLPTLLFNGMVRPITPLRIRGVVWYQGESNVTRAVQYASTFKRLITDWRSQWGQGDFPFYFVQLAAFLPLKDNTLTGSPWAELRDAQRQALALPHTGMVVATDIGDANDIHPRNKQEVGLRLALVALRQDYHRTVIGEGPSLRSMKVSGKQAVLRFRNAPAGPVARGTDGTLNGFAIAGIDGQFRPAQARVEGDRVHVSSVDVPEPRHVRFGWVDNPQQDNLYNRAGLPASPFRTDALPLTTHGVKFPK